MYPSISFLTPSFSSFTPSLICFLMSASVALACYSAVARECIFIFFPFSVSAFPSAP